MSNGELDIVSGTVDLINRYEALEAVPCKATAEVIANLEGQLESVRQVGCCDCQVAIADLRIALESIQAPPLGQLASVIARLDLTLSSLPQMPSVPELPIGQVPVPVIVVSPGQAPSAGPPSGLTAPVLFPESPTQPAPPEGVAPTAPAPLPHVPIPGEVCPPEPPPAPEPGELVKVEEGCGAQLHALGGPVAEGTMQPSVFWAAKPGELLLTSLKPISNPVLREIGFSADWEQLEHRLATIMPEIP